MSVPWVAITAAVIIAVAPARVIADDDAVVTVVPPLRVVIPSDKPQVTRKVRVGVSNANAASAQSIELTATTSDCPAGTLATQPDFEASTPGIQSIVTLAARKARQAVLTLPVTTAFETFNRHTPNRCAITFTVASTAPGNLDPTPDNNATTMELNVLDLSDPEQSAVHETIVESYRVVHPGKIEIFAGSSSRTDRIRVVVTNGDSDEQPGDLITLSAGDGDCPAATVGVPDFDKDTPGSQNSVVVEGQRHARGTLDVTVHAGDFFSPHRQSLGRCTALLTVSGPGGDSDASNDTTRVPIGVFDRNDL